MSEKRALIQGQQSWVVENDQVEMAVTIQGGHMAPVTFFRGTPAAVQPYYISPWQGTGFQTGVPVLDVLRGDFFCMPFGDGAWRGESHPVHGESAGSEWSFEEARKDGRVTELRLGLETKVRPGRITKRLLLVDGQNAVYCRHDLAGYEGRMCLSHHAILAVPEEPGSLRVSTAPARLSMVVPRTAPANTGNEYYFLDPGKRFTSLARVPTIWKHAPFADCSTHPLPYGFMDLVCVYPRIQESTGVDRRDSAGPRLALVRASQPAGAAADHVLDVQRRPARAAVERTSTGASGWRTAAHCTPSDLPSPSSGTRSTGRASRPP